MIEIVSILVAADDGEHAHSLNVNHIVRRHTCREVCCSMARCDDVDGALVHVSLAKLPDSPTRQQLLSIRTGLTLRQDDVDLLIEAGRSAILTVTQIRCVTSCMISRSSRGRGQSLPAFSDSESARHRSCSLMRAPSSTNPCGIDTEWLLR